jgi:hypothetical protein
MPASSARSRCSLRVLIICAAAMASLSCASANSTPASQPGPDAPSPDTRLQVWRGGRAVTLREVTLDADSIRGKEVVPLGGFSRARIAIARSEVDSLRQAPSDKDNWFGAGVAVGVIGAIVFPYLIRVLGPRGT